jgi:hypothetical protein
MPATAGHATRAVFLWEDDSNGNHNFAGTPNDSDHKTFGANVSVDTAEFDNNAVNQFDPGDREPSSRVAQAFSGSWSTSFTLANPWFWRAVIAEPSTSGTGPYTHTFDGSVPWSMQIILPVESTGNERILKGCVATSCTLEVSDNGQVSVTLSGPYADEEETSPGSGSLQAQVSESFDALQFGDGSLTLDSTTFDIVQGVTITIENNIDLVPALGQRTPADYSPKVRSTTVEWSKIVENDSNLTTRYGGGGTSPASRVDSDDEFSGDLTFDNGETGSSQNKQVVNFSGVFPDTYGRSGTGDPTADYVEEMSDFVREIDVVATNNTSSAP